MQYGYARVSSADQDTALQLDAFHRAGVPNVIREQGSARKARPVLDRVLGELRPGDELVVYKVDRIARSIRQLTGILEHIAERGAAFRSLTEPFDTRTPAGRMMVQLLGVVAEFEWHMIRDRSMAGQRAAIARGIRLGRPRAFTEAQEAELCAAMKRGVSMSQLSRVHQVTVSTIKRVRERDPLLRR